MCYYRHFARDRNIRTNIQSDTYENTTLDYVNILSALIFCTYYISRLVVRFGSVGIQGLLVERKKVHFFVGLLASCLRAYTLFLRSNMLID